MRPHARSPGSHAREWSLVAVLFAGLTTIAMWPQPLQWRTHTPGHHDVLFSMWRLSWIGEALTTAPMQLFDAPIFHPATRTLAFSDAVFLQGLLATPALAAGAPVLPVYNVLLLLGPWMSGLGAYLLARDLLTLGDGRLGEPSLPIASHGPQGDPALPAPRVFWPAVMAGAVFGLLPYRVEHIMHLELQWSQWMPLACWSLHRTVSHGRWRDGVLTALFVLLQFLSCIYYGVFLALVLVLAAPVLLLTRRRATVPRIARALAMGAVLTAGPLMAYAAPYRENQARLGGRAAGEIAMWSATPASFLSAPPDNLLYGDTAARSTAEGRLLPGVTALVLAVLGVVVMRRRRETWMYAVVLAASTVLALGTHSPAWRLALIAVPPLRGLRAPARFGMVAALGLGLLAAFGAAWLIARTSGPIRQHVAGMALSALLMVEYASDVAPLRPWTQRPPLYATWLRQQPPGTVLDLPIARASALPLHEAEWSFYARFHGYPLVNGYSGYYPPEYIALLGQMVYFPNPVSLAMLRDRNVRYIVVHVDRYRPDEYIALETRLRQTPGITTVGLVPDREFPASVFVLEPDDAEGRPARPVAGDPRATGRAQSKK